MDVLVEVHNKDELKRALPLESRLIGINNRDLHTFVTNLEVSETLAPLVPKDRIIISESGIGSHEDCLRLSKCRINAFLVGESLMRQQNVEEATFELLHGKRLKPLVNK
jgi:indole-3-glycerol phosphate synthase